VLIRWALDRGCSVLPKSTNPDRIAANLAVMDWQLAPADVERLAQLPYKVGAGMVSQWLGR
jgi:diketogulonate reductase-like aldo/keto reductase